jgi:hypothetical protein
VFRWYGQVEKMEEEWLKEYKSKGRRGSRGRVSPKLRWIDGVQAVVERRGANIE